MFANQNQFKDSEDERNSQKDNLEAQNLLDLGEDDDSDFDNDYQDNDHDKNFIQKPEIKKQQQLQQNQDNNVYQQKDVPRKSNPIQNFLYDDNEDNNGGVNPFTGQPYGGGAQNNLYSRYNPSQNKQNYDSPLLQQNEGNSNSQNLLQKSNNAQNSNNNQNLSNSTTSGVDFRQQKYQQYLNQKKNMQKQFTSGNAGGVGIIQQNENYKQNQQNPFGYKGISQKNENDEEFIQNLQGIVPNNQRQQWEPGQKSQQTVNLPNKLEAVKQKITQPEVPKEQEEKYKKNAQIKKEKADSDDVDEEEKIQKKKKKIKELRKQQTQKESSSGNSSDSQDDDDEEDEEELKRLQELEKQKQEKKKKKKEKHHDKHEKVAMQNQHQDQQPTIPNQAQETLKEQQLKEQQAQAQQLQQQQQAPIAKILDIEIDDMRTFLINPVPRGAILQCQIKRDKSGMSRFYPKYHMLLSNQLRYMMSAKKKMLNKTSNYLISMQKDNFNKKAQGFIGKLRSNFWGTEFLVFDNGENPKKATTPEKVRQQLGVVIYESNILGSKGPRKMKVIIPDVKQDGNRFEFKPLNEKDGILLNWKNGRREGIRFLFNKPPKWNEQVQAFVLNFNGRVDKPSVKNFQLIDEYDDNIIYLQFGRVGTDAFNVDVQWPMSPLQAFAICLSSFDYKLACE